MLNLPQPRHSGNRNGSSAISTGATQNGNADMGLFKADLFRSFALGFALGAAGLLAASNGVFSDPAALLSSAAHASALK